CSATGLGQVSRKHEPLPASKPNNAKCIADMASGIPSRVLNHYNNSGTDNLVGLYSDAKVDVYTDQKVIDWFIQSPAPYAGEFSGPLYVAFRDEATRQSIIKKIRNNRPESFQPNMTCTVLDPEYGNPTKRNQDCANGG